MLHSKAIMFATVAVGAILAIGAASAADMPAHPYAKAAPMAAPASYGWTGWYAGINAGAAIDDSRYTLDPAGCFLNGCGAGGVAGNASRRYSTGLNGSGFTGGGQVGYNYQITSLWVAGLEADFNYNGVRESDAVTQALSPPLFSNGSFTHNTTESLDWFGTVRGRLGFLAAPSLMIYGSGGLAYGQVTSTTNAGFSGSADTYAGSLSDTRVGWTAGGGAEWKLTSAWSVKAEYLYVDLGRASYADRCTSAAAACAGGNPPAYQTNLVTREHVMRVGINYQFNNPMVARY